MDDSHDATIRAQVHAPESDSHRDAILVHIYPTGPQMGTRYIVSSEPLILGRGDSCDIPIHDHSVSRRHAAVKAGPGGVIVADLGSTNGTFLNDVRVVDAILKDGDYLRVGNCIYRFLAGGNVEADYHEEIYRLTIIDGLTEIHNKRYLMEFLERELARCERYGRPLSLVLFDIDRFKQLNDELGHLTGDHALRELAACVKGVVRREELFARYGGEEFVVVLPETPGESAVAFAERVRAAVAGHGFAYHDEPFALTVSLGVASTVGGEACRAEELIEQADKALYRAKKDGRNRVCCWADGRATAAAPRADPAEAQ